MQLGTEKIDEATSGPGESGRVNKVLDAGFKQPAAETVLVQSESGLTLADPRFRVAVDEAIASLEASPDVENIESPLDPAFADQVSAGRQQRADRLRDPRRPRRRGRPR